MNSMLVTLIEQNLPPLPDTVMKLRDYIDEKGSNIDIQGVSNIISKDPLTTANLLKTANSAYYGFSQEISTIQQVITLLGIENVKNIIMADSLRAQININVSPYGLDTNIFIGNCAKEVDFIANWLNDEDKKLAQTLIPCAMLLRLGMILFSSVLIKSQQDGAFLRALKDSNFHNIALVEQEFFGVDHVSFLAYCFDHWKFDESLIHTVVYATSPHSAPPSTQKSAYALAITNRIFEPYEGGDDYNRHEALLLIKEAAQKNIIFNEQHLIRHLEQISRI